MPIVFNDSIVVHAGKPIDAKFGPYNSIAEANASIPLERRYNGLIFGINTVPNGLENTDIKYYYYYGSFTDVEIKELFALGDLNFVFNQNIPSNLWNVTHNLGKFPSVTVVDSANNEVEGDVIHINENQTQLIFSGSFSGRAFFN
jgi:hypothetical protein